MIRALYSAASGMQAQETNIDVVSNNLANVNTTGYKRTRATFQDLMYQEIVEPGAPTSATTTSPSGIQVGLGVKTSSTQRVFGQGDLQSTENPFDVAVEGDGFFQVTRPDGTLAYTRAGNLQLNENGNLVTSEGYPIAGANAIPENALAVTIAFDGQISVRLPGSTTPTEAGQITAVRFSNSTGLRALGQNLFEETTSSGGPITGNFADPGFGRLSQGFLESSNVSVVNEVVNMITAQRAYEAASKGITTADEMIGQAINVKR